MIKKLSMLTMLVLILAACGNVDLGGGGNSGGGNGGGNVSNQATAVEALAVTEAPSQSGGETTVDEVTEAKEDELGLGFNLVPDVDHFSEILTSPFTEWDCSGSSASGDTSDADDDGIAKNATYTISCTKDFSFAGFGSPVSVTREGTLTMQDQDDNDPTSGYDATGNATYTYKLMGTNTVTVTREFSRHWQKNASAYSFNHSNDWEWASAMGMGMPSTSYKVEQARSGSYIPDDPTKPFKAGQLTETGSIKHFVNDSVQKEVAETANLHLNDQCDPPADDGSIVLGWDGVTKTIEFTGCGEYGVQ